MKIYYDKDIDLKELEDEVIGIIGYGIQGRAHALNLRDSGIKVIVSNRKDRYCQQAVDDGFYVHEPGELVKKASIVMMLIPDQSHKEVFNKFIGPYLKEGSMLTVAHGYSIRFNQVVCPENVDLVLLAPRFPGGVLRENFLKNKGTLAFFDVVNDFTGRAEKRGLALAKAIGFAREGCLLNVSLKEETEVDLFIEQFLIPSFLNTIQTGFDVLVESGYTPEVALMELYQSGEIIGLLSEGRKVGMYKAFHKNTSPTCQFGVKESFERIITKESRETAKKILEEIKNGDFSKKLEAEEKAGYIALEAFNQKNAENKFSKAQEKFFKNGTDYWH